MRTREYLTKAETDRLLDATRGTRYPARDYCLVLICLRHALRVSELTDLQWSQVNFEEATMAVRRKKGGVSSTHPIRGDELRALRRLQRTQDPKSLFIFTTERGAPFATGGVRTLFARLGEEAGFTFRLHPHMMRHSAGHRLANRGVDTRSLQSFLGHKNIQHTCAYSEMAPNRFKNFWDDE